MASSGVFTIATWNLERPRPRSWKILPRQRARMAAVDADVWVLTETRASIAPAEGYHGVHCPPLPERTHDEDERYVSIWSRWPLEPTAVPPHPRGSASALLATPWGPVIVYGTVLPWAHDKGPAGTARLWEVHAEHVERQGAEWAELRRQHPDAPLVVAGDFNQDRDGSGWYGTHRVRGLLTAELEGAGLTLLTDEDMQAAGRYDGHLIDHIAISGSLALADDVGVIGLRDSDGVRLSDHPTVIVDVVSSG